MTRPATPPATILELMPTTRGRAVSITPLSGGMTNHNYRVDVQDAAGSRDSYVLRLTGADPGSLGIDRLSEIACSQAAALAGLGPELVEFLPEHGALLRRFVPGRVLSPDDIRQPSVLERLVPALRRYHEGPPGAGRFDVFSTIRSYHAQAMACGIVFPNSMGDALEALVRLEVQRPGNDAPCPCHNDLLAANVIDSPNGLRVIDWEYAGMGDRFFDLGNLAVNNGFTPEDERRLLELYFLQAEDRDLRRLRRMRLASDLRESLWGFLQAGLGAGTVDYHAYGCRHLERFLEGLGRAEG